MLEDVEGAANDAVSVVEKYIIKPVDDYVFKPAFGFVSDVVDEGVDIVKSVATGGRSLVTGIEDIYANRYIILAIAIVLIILIKKI